jgi:hypothetical protein
MNYGTLRCIRPFLRGLSLEVYRYPNIKLLYSYFSLLIWFYLNCFIIFIFRNIDAVENFIDLGADVNLRCHGTPSLSLAIMMSSLPGAESFCSSAVAMILNCSCDLTAKVN